MITKKGSQYIYSKKKGQKVFEKYIGSRSEWMAIFHKNYLQGGQMKTLEKIGYKTEHNILVNYSKNKKMYYFKFEKDDTKTVIIIDWKNQKIYKFNKNNCKYEKFGIDEMYALREILRATRTIFEEIRGV